MSHSYPPEDDGIIAADPRDCESCQESPTGACRYHAALPVPQSPPEKLIGTHIRFDDDSADDES